MLNVHVNKISWAPTKNFNTKFCKLEITVLVWGRVLLHDK